MNGLEREIKAPKGEGKWLIKNTLQKAQQQSENIIIDLRRIKIHQDKCTMALTREFSYSKRIKSLKWLNKGDSVAVPADRANEIRALKVLQGEDLIDFEIDPQSGEIVFKKNQLHLEFKLYDAALLYGSLDEVTCAFINGNYAFENGLNPVTDSIFREKLDLGDSDNPFVKVLVANSNLEEDKQSILRRALFYYQTGAVAEIIKQMQGGSLIPAFLPRF